MRRLTLILAAGALLAGGATADAKKGDGGGTPPSYAVCSPDSNLANEGYDGTCTSTNPAGRQCTQTFVNGQSTFYECRKT